MTSSRGDERRGADRGVGRGPAFLSIPEWELKENEMSRAERGRDGYLVICSRERELRSEPRERKTTRARTGGTVPVLLEGLTHYQSSTADD